MQADSPFAQRLTLADRSWRSTFRDQPSQDRYLIVQTAGEMRLGSTAQARSIACKSGDRATMIDVVALGSRQVADYAPPQSARGLVDGSCPCNFHQLTIPLTTSHRTHAR